VARDTEAALQSEVDGLLQPQRKLLAGLMRSEALSRGDVSLALRQVTEVAAQTLKVARASVWRLNDAHTRLECLNLFEAAAQRHSAGSVIEAAAFPRYFQALDTERTLVAHAARTDERTAELSEPYLVPNGIHAMLDAPIFFRGRMLGVVCHEHEDAPREWQLWEELLAGTMADFVSMVLEAAERVERERELGVYRQQLERMVEERTQELEARNEDLRREMVERERAEQQLRELATRDPLTDAINRRHFFELELQRSHRYKRPLSLAMIDADHFKKVNDLHGHLSGDQVLRTIVELCRSSLRKSDLLARYGGEEFVVLLPETTIATARGVVERLRRAVGDQVLLGNGGEIRFTVSAGVVSLRHGSEETLEGLLRRADEALYRAKAAGRNRVEVMDDDRP
jgi:diguanylate cyclase (GGDEF)-like protein